MGFRIQPNTRLPCPIVTRVSDLGKFQHCLRLISVSALSFIACFACLHEWNQKI